MGEPAPKCATAFVSASASGLGGTKWRLPRWITRGGGSIASARHPGRQLPDCAKAPQSGLQAGCKPAPRRPLREKRHGREGAERKSGERDLDPHASSQRLAARARRAGRRAHRCGALFRRAAPSPDQGAIERVLHRLGSRQPHPACQRERGTHGRISGDFRRAPHRAGQRTAGAQGASPGLGLFGALCARARAISHRLTALAHAAGHPLLPRRRPSRRRVAPPEDRGGGRCGRVLRWPRRHRPALGYARAPAR